MRPRIIRHDKRRSRHPARGAGGLCSIGNRLIPVASSIEDFEGALEMAWATSVGASLGKRTRLLGVENGLLVVEVSDATWQAALRGMAKHVLPRLRESLASRAPIGLHVIVASSQQGSSQASSKERARLAMNRRQSPPRPPPTRKPERS